MYFTNPYRTYLPKVVRPNLPAPAPLRTEDITIKGTVFQVIEIQKDIVTLLLEDNDVYMKVIELPFRKVVVHLRDTEYPEVSPLYTKNTLPVLDDIKIYADSERNGQHFVNIELWVEL